MDRVITDVLRVVIGTWIALALLWFILRQLGKVPGLATFSAGATKLATPSS